MKGLPFRWTLKDRFRAARLRASCGRYGSVLLGRTASSFGRYGLQLGDFDEVLVGIAQIKRLAHAMIRRTVEFDARCDQAPQRIRQQRARRIEDGHVIQTRCARRRRRTARALPRVQPDVMMITARRQKHRLLPVTLHHLEAQHIAPEAKRTFELGHLQMHVPDADAGVDGVGIRLVWHEIKTGCST